MSPITHALTVDVEDYFQVSAFSDRVCRSTWDKLECRVEANTDRMLALFDEQQVRGTFFVLGWVAARYPKLIQRISAAGHELASHGYWHQLVYDLTPEEFARDICDSKEAIADATGKVVTAYRAPSFSITNKSLWALDILAEHGFETDSSIFPLRGHDRYGIPDADKEIHSRETSGGVIQEFPPTAAKVTGLTVPVGGGYFRLFPRALTSAAIRRIESEGRPAMFYTHPWEIDPQQPRVAGVGMNSRFRHYVNLNRTHTKLRQLLTNHNFGTMSKSLACVHPTATTNSTEAMVRPLLEANPSNCIQRIQR